MARCVSVPISSDGIQGDWQPLATLVRVPQLKELKCVEGAPLCTLVGTDLFLLDQVGIDAQLANAVTVPEGFGEATLSVPRPNGTLYLKLRDDPAVVNTAVLPVTAEPSQSAAVTPLAVAPAPATAHQTDQKPAQQSCASAPAQPTTDDRISAPELAPTFACS